MGVWILAAILAASPDVGWNNLKRVTRDRLYTIVLRDGQCKYGVISSVGDQGLVLGTDLASGVVIKRPDIARVSDNVSDPARDIVFSARSSWTDVQAAALTRTGYLEIVTKKEDRWKWRRASVSLDSITSGTTVVSKDSIQSIAQIRPKPLTVEEEYVHDPDFRWLAAIPWVGAMMPTRISVWLYDSDAAEDNSTVRCH